MQQARGALATWREDYNGARPHSKLSWQTPAAFAATFYPHWDLALRSANGSASVPVAHTAQKGHPNHRGELRAG
ncbi:integrase core domain-containing protein [Labrys sedimenti]|uniref:integrase core domain-containing protein n=1 Tax=Labrys sedimenti TaxID=3106036 RepID=UPI003CD07D93